MFVICILLFSAFIIYKNTARRGGPLDVITSKVVNPISYLYFEDLEKLSTGQAISEELREKLNKQLSTPYIVNGVSSQIRHASLKNPYLRITQWNIASGGRVDVIKQIFLDPKKFYNKYKQKVEKPLTSDLKKEIELLSTNDIIFLNEVDIGLPRTGYANIAKEISRSLGYNYAFATEFIELGPIVHKQKIHKSVYLGLHGNAILSKFPIVSAEVLSLPECYDWFGEELKSRSPLEHVRVASAKTVFEQRILTEVRRGTRNALIAKIKLPNNEFVTIVSTHLEDRCFPSGRLKQMKVLLAKLRNITGPLVIGGDFNTSTTDTAPTSFRKEIIKRLKDPNFIARQAAFAAIPGLPIASGVGTIIVSKLLQYKDPTYPSIPVIFPNNERPLFLYMEDFRFADGEMFDFGGDPNRSFGKAGYLSNSNERVSKGFEQTFEFTEPRFIAYFKLDWFFVKPYQGRFKPYNGQTLKVLNESYPEKISDHNPITVDISL
ncbi:MAG: endonuclease/exonuclease/phosphatase family protein [Candidatus Melainabacteria bacterium]|nr:endonuclease/exonuclease/phosphatase family protein [Candidatus Melainabacteria bacterium]